MENWRFVKEVLAVVTIMATVFLAYGSLTAASAVQENRISTLEKTHLMLKEDLVKRLDRIEDRINEIIENQRNR